MRHLWMISILLASVISPLNSVAAAGPDLTVITPEEGAVINGTRVGVEFKATDFKIVESSVPVSEFGKRPDANRLGEGHVHLTLDAQPLVVWYSADAYTFKEVAPGEHQLMVELVNNDHSSLTPPLMRLIRFKVGPGTLPVTGEEPAAPQEGSLALLVLAMLLILAGGIARRRGHVWKEGKRHQASVKTATLTLP
jgi:hypothetical protein